MMLNKPYKTGCIARGTEVYCVKTGTWEKVEKLVGKGRRLVDSLDTCTHELKVKQTDYFWREKQKGKILEVRTSGGHIVQVQEDHEFWARERGKDGNLKRKAMWGKAKKLKVRDSLATVSMVHKPSKEITMPEEEIKYLAYMISEGRFPSNERKRCEFSNTDDKIINEFIECHIKLFKDAEVYVTDEYSKGHKRKKPKTIVGQSIKKNKKLGQFVSKYGWMGKNSGTIRVPKQIFQLSNDQWKVFLSRIFAGDGWVYALDKHACEIGYASKNYCLCLDVHRLLLRFGIFSVIRKKNAKLNGKIFPNYSLKIRKRKDLKRFAYQIGFFTKAMKLAKLKKVVRNKKGKNDYGSYRRWKDIIWDRIASIECVGVQEYYDTYVLGTKNYNANGFICRSSLKNRARKRGSD